MTMTQSQVKAESAAARLLVVDDEEEVLRIFREFLSNEGYDVSSCFNGAQACEKIRTGDFDLVITDMVMSPVPGEEVLRFVSENAPDTQAIVVTAFATFERLQEALRRQVYDFVEKPVDLPDLSRSVRGAVEKAREAKKERRLISNLRTRNDQLVDEVRRATAGLEPDTLADPGTGLPGYQAFRSCLETEISRSIQTRAPLTLAMIHLDRVPAFGGEGGREPAEAFYREVGEYFRASIRRADIVFRYGECQLAIVFPDSGSEGVMKCVERLVARGANRTWKTVPGEGSVELEFSAGLASAPSNAGNFDELVRAADRALDAAKRGSRGRVQRA